MQFAREYCNREFEYEIYSILSDKFEFDESIDDSLSDSIDIVVEYLNTLK
jgi:hypothetical protein